METFDVVVIGSGPGGYPAAIRAAQLGASVALVERESLGGTCLNWGCIPTKALIASADLYARIRHGEQLGLHVSDVTVDYPAMVERKNGAVTQLTSGVAQLLKGNGVQVFKGTASFLDRNRIQVSTSAPRRKARSAAKPVVIRAENTIIATGSEPLIPAFLPKSKRVVDSRAFLERKMLPESLLVLGGGVIGCEFACLAAQLGVQVTVVEMLDDILIMLDADIRRELRRHMEGELGIRVLCGEPLKTLTVGKDGVRGSVGKETLSAQLALISVGRKPVTTGLSLKKAGITTDNRGFIPIDAQCATAAAGIYAVGDVTAGTTQLAHEATSQGLTAAGNICNRGREARETLVPACIFTSPEIGTVGLSEQEARGAGRAVKTGKYSFAALGKGIASGETAGFVKWVADSETDQLLGAHTVGRHATELIAEAAAAVRAELTAEELGQTIHCHPTFSEAWMEAAHALHGRCIHAAPVRRRR